MLFIWKQWLCNKNATLNWLSEIIEVLFVNGYLLMIGGDVVYMSMCVVVCYKKVCVCIIGCRCMICVFK